MNYAPTVKSQAFIPNFISTAGKHPVATELASVVSGVVAISLLAQVVIPLGFTPVPITGQTFGVMLVSLLWGSRRGALILTAYLATGALGLPVFADAQSGLTWGPTLGYLIGMGLSAYAIGFLADRGWSKTFTRAFAACMIGSVLIFSSGLLVLSFFIPVGLKQLLLAGFIPFIPGDLIKMTLAASIASKARYSRIRPR